jgi:hypothetical protein
MSVSFPEAGEEGWPVSLLTWGGLVLAGALFASATLAPRWQALQELRSRYAENQHRLVRLDRQAEELERVIEALESDPQFATELVKLEFSASRRGDESIPVRPELQLGVDPMPVSPPPDTRSSTVVHLATFASGWLATHKVMRATMLVFAAVVGLVSLLGLTNEQAAAVRRTVAALRTAAGRFRDRYQQT